MQMNALQSHSSRCSATFQGKSDIFRQLASIIHEFLGSRHCKLPVTWCAPPCRVRYGSTSRALQLSCRSQGWQDLAKALPPKETCFMPYADTLKKPMKVPQVTSTLQERTSKASASTTTRQGCSSQLSLQPQCTGRWFQEASI